MPTIRQIHRGRDWKKSCRLASTHASSNKAVEDSCHGTPCPVNISLHNRCYNKTGEDGICRDASADECVPWPAQL